MATGASMQWILAHELAHQIYGHIDQPFHDPVTADDLARSRDDEYEADRFAFRTLKQRGLDPIQAMPAYLFIGLSGSSAEDEKTSTHPSGPRRFSILYDALTSEISDPQFNDYVRSSGQLEKWRQAVETMRVLAEP
jgi:hypothetical protein